MNPSSPSSSPLSLYIRGKPNERRRIKRRRKTLLLLVNSFHIETIFAFCFWLLLLFRENTMNVSLSLQCLNNDDDDDDCCIHLSTNPNIIQNKEKKTRNICCLATSNNNEMKWNKMNGMKWRKKLSSI